MLAYIGNDGSKKDCLVWSSILISPQVFAVEKIQKITAAESILPMLFGLLVILASIFLLAFIFKKYSNFGLVSKTIKVIESQPLGNKEKLMIIQVQEQQFLIGVTPQSISQLGEISPQIVTKQAAVTKAHNPLNSNFGQIVAKLMNLDNHKTNDATLKHEKVA